MALALMISFEMHSCCCSSLSFLSGKIFPSRKTYRNYWELIISKVLILNSATMLRQFILALKVVWYYSKLFMFKTESIFKRESWIFLVSFFYNNNFQVKEKSKQSSLKIVSQKNKTNSRQNFHMFSIWSSLLVFCWIFWPTSFCWFFFIFLLFID